ncbi:unnamed protein product [Ambrosiozyma monospora]|uniref:Unnamed protein product n=1 Tax=Ambrosiozyma monospora TaxID=43982 RepID=A0A9W6Z3X0_AMBMO|nr:unnamed protein product [Ambrosiozyma monospora]
MARKRACDRCHEIKQTCSGEMPCSRCRTKNITCVFNRPIKKTGRPSKHSKQTQIGVNSSIHGPVNISNSPLVSLGAIGSLKDGHLQLNKTSNEKANGNGNSYFNHSSSQQQPQQPTQSNQQQQQQQQQQQNGPSSSNHYIGWRETGSHTSISSPNANSPPLQSRFLHTQPQHQLPPPNSTNNYPTPAHSRSALFPLQPQYNQYPPIGNNQHSPLQTGYQPHSQIQSPQQQRTPISVSSGPSISLAPPRQQEQYQPQSYTPHYTSQTPTPPNQQSGQQNNLMGQTNQTGQVSLNFSSNVSTPATPSGNISPSIEPPHKIAKVMPNIQCPGPVQPSPTSGNSTPNQQNQFQEFHHSRPYVSSYNTSNGTNNTSSPGCFTHAPSASLSSISSRNLQLPLPMPPQLSHPTSTLGTPINSASTSYFGNYHNPSLSTSSLPPLSPVVQPKPNLSNNLTQSKFASTSKITSPTLLSGKPPDTTIDSNISTVTNATAVTVTVAVPLAQLNERILQEITNSKELPEIERFYLKYFVTNVVPVLFSNDSSDSFLRNIVPLALDHKIIRDPIMAIAATHRSFDYVSGRSGKRLFTRYT